MDQLTVATFLEQNNDLFFPNKEYSDIAIEDALLAAPDELEMTIRSVAYRKPSTVQLLSVFPGQLGVDRFYLGDIGLGVLKYFTFAGIGIWWLVDIFTAKDRCRAYNCKKLLEALRNPYGAMGSSSDDGLKKAVDTAKQYAPIAKDLAKGFGEIGSTFRADPPR